MISLKKFENGFEYIEVQNRYAKAKIALQGAHLFHYKVKDKPALLWVSKKAYFEKGKAIRGGVPICFPWFGKHKVDTTLPQHGFARTALWKVVLQEEQDDGTTHIRLELNSNPDTYTLWEYAFTCHIDIFIAQTLKMHLSVTNTDTKPFEISTALHSYFAISNIETVYVKGLEDKVYYDALKDAYFTQKGNLFIDKEIDRVYKNPLQNITLVDEEQHINITHEGSKSLVVWNPWKEKSKEMVDMDENGYKHMLCLETSNAREDSRILAPKQTHILTVNISQAQI